MGSVVVDGVTFQVYGDSAGAIAYVAGVVTASASAWRALTGNEQNRSLVNATYMLNRQEWTGAPTQPFPGTQPLAWPRTGVTDADGNAIDPSTIPTAIIDGAYELAVALAADPDLQANAYAGDKNVRRVDAKGVSVDFFGPQLGGRFPTVVQELIGAFLASATATVGIAVASGTSDCSRVGDSDDFDLTGGI